MRKLDHGKLIIRSVFKAFYFINDPPAATGHERELKPRQGILLLFSVFSLLLVYQHSLLVF